MQIHRLEDNRFEPRCSKFKLKAATEESKFWEGLHYAIRHKIHFQNRFTDLSLEINQRDSQISVDKKNLVFTLQKSKITFFWIWTQNAHRAIPARKLHKTPWE